MNHPDKYARLVGQELSRFEDLDALAVIEQPQARAGPSSFDRHRITSTRRGENGA
jgi:hypothetical protein